MRHISSSFVSLISGRKMNMGNCELKMGTLSTEKISGWEKLHLLTPYLMDDAKW